MTPTDVSAAMASYARSQIGAAYIMGATAEACTPRYRASLAGGRSADYADKIRSCCPVLSGDQADCTGCRWEGRLAFDCAQLTRHAAEAAGLSLPSGATSQWQDGAWAATGLIDTLPVDHVCLLFRRKAGAGTMVHTGLYLGDGTVAEARGHADGVIRSDLNDYPWTHWGILRGMACPGDVAQHVDKPTLRRGSRGESVRELQRILRSHGYDLQIDGVFGYITENCVKSLQGALCLEEDGICGPMTWAALLNGSPAVYTVTITGLTESAARRIVAEHGGTCAKEDMHT